MKAGGLLAVVVAAFALVVFAVPAGAGHPQGSKAAMSLMEGNEGSVFRSAVAADPPLQGAGENMEIVANVPLAPNATVDGPQTVPGGANDASFGTNASDIELAGDHAYVGSPTQGLVVVNIASCNDPKQPAKCKPFVQGVYRCSGGQFDVQLSPDANLAIVAHESASNSKKCHPGEEGAAIVDVSDKANPREIAFISDRKPDKSASGNVVDGAHNVTLDFPNLYIDNYTQTYPQTEIFSLAPQAAAPDASPSNPKLIGKIDFTANGTSGPHDSFPLHRPDGKDLLYAASIQKSDIVNIDDPTKPRVVQTIVDPEVGISHGAEPNFDRSLMIVTDEYGGGTGVGACGGRGDASPLVPGQAGAAGVGAVHFYRLDKASGLVGNNGTDKAGVFNIDVQPNEPDQVAADAGCTSHVFWQAPDENRMAIAWYGRGTRIVDFSDPAKPRQIGSFVPAGANTWSAKPHRGFIFTGDIVRGMDVLRYTGEGGNRWPTTSGPAELQRGATQRSGPGTGKGPAAQVPVGKRLVISRRTRRTRGRVVPVVVACRQSTTCRGAVRLRAKFRQRGSRVFRRIRVGQRRFEVPAGKRQTLRVKVNRRGRKLLRNRRKVRVIVGARLEPQAFTSSGTLTVKASFRLLRRARR